MSATISDVAKKAGVSPATVSKYLNKKTVSDKSCNRIEDAIRELNYQVNDFARSLRTNTSKLIGLLVPSMDDNFATSLFKKMEERLTAYNYSTILYNYNNSGAAFLEKVAFVRQRMVDGVIILLSGKTKELFRQGLRELQLANIPYVLVNGRVDGIEADTVVADNAKAIHNCVTHLLQSGHRKIGMIIVQRSSYNAKERIAGFRKAYADFGLMVDEELLFDFDDCKNWVPVAKERMMGFLQAHPELTAMVFPSYRLTIAGINAIHHTGRKIGEDLALIGFDCDVVNAVLNQSIPYIRLPAEEFAVNAIELLISAIKHEGEKPPQLIRISAQRIEGDSVFKI